MIETYRQLGRQREAELLECAERSRRRPRTRRPLAASLRLTARFRMLGARLRLHPRLAD